jgi:hypothetical protein
MHFSTGISQLISLSAFVVPQSISDDGRACSFSIPPLQTPFGTGVATKDI